VQKTNPCFGQGDNISPKGYVTVDGLKFINARYKVIAWGGSSDGGSPHIQGLITQNCEFAQINWSTAPGGNNMSCIDTTGGLNQIIRNNYFHGMTGQSGATDGDHCTTTQDWSCWGTLFEYNTILGPGMYGKEGAQAGQTIRYNYIDNSGWTNVFGIQDFIGGDSTSTGRTTNIHHNVFVTNSNDLRPTLGGASFCADPVNIYNNTFVQQASGEKRATGVILRTDTGKLSYYNNIHYSRGSGWLMVPNVEGPGVMDYNSYFSTGSYSYGYFTSKTQTGAPNSVGTLASWKALMTVACEAHALDHVDPQFTGPLVGGSGSAPFKLAAGSPCIGTGRGGVNMGAWDGAVTQIGCSFAPGASSAGTPVPDAPQLSVT
jgi:hypothetical protein